MDIEEAERKLKEIEILALQIANDKQLELIESSGRFRGKANWIFDVINN